jgi:hypothetical protein
LKEKCDLKNVKFFKFHIKNVSEFKNVHIFKSCDLKNVQPKKTKNKLKNQEKS